MNMSAISLHNNWIDKTHKTTTIEQYMMRKLKEDKNKIINRLEQQLNIFESIELNKNTNYWIEMKNKHNWLNIICRFGAEMEMEMKQEGTYVVVVMERKNTPLGGDCSKISAWMLPLGASQTLTRWDKMKENKSHTILSQFEYSNLSSNF